MTQGYSIMRSRRDLIVFLLYCQHLEGVKVLAAYSDYHTFETVKIMYFAGVTRFILLALSRNL